MSQSFAIVPMGKIVNADPIRVNLKAVAMRVETSGSAWIFVYDENDARTLSHAFAKLAERKLSPEPAPLTEQSKADDVSGQAKLGIALGDGITRGIGAGIGLAIIFSAIEGINSLVAWAFA